MTWFVIGWFAGNIWAGTWAFLYYDRDARRQREWMRRRIEASEDSGEAWKQGLDEDES